MIRIAAVGDVHVDKDVVGRYRPALEELPGRADALLIAGDLTRHGTVEEAKCFATEFGGLAVPVVVCLGNHDHQSDQQDQLTQVLTDAGITVLEGTASLGEGQAHRNHRGNLGWQRHLRPVTTMERTMCLPSAPNSRISGTMATVVAAITTVHCAS